MRTDRYQTEAELAAALNKGDQEAFEAIYRAFAPELFQHIQRNITTSEDCEEILHDIFEWIWRNHDKVKFDSLRNYLFKMANNHILGYFRKAKAKRNYEKHFALFEMAYNYIHADEGEGTIDPDGLKSLLQKSLPELPERCREAFTLRLTENLSNAEIAQRMNIKKDTVENYMVRALSHLHHSYMSLYRAS